MFHFVNMLCHSTNIDVLSFLSMFYNFLNRELIYFLLDLFWVFGLFLFVWLKNKHLFLTAEEDRSARSGHQHGWVLVKSLSWFSDHGLLIVCSHSGERAVFDFLMPPFFGILAPEILTALEAL